MHQGYKRWDQRKNLIMDQLGELKPDVLALNEISIPADSGRWLWRAANSKFGADYAFVQQSKAGSLSVEEAQGILTKFSIVESANLDYMARERVAQVVRLRLTDKTFVDVYVTHLHHVQGEDGLRQYQVQMLLKWIASRNDLNTQIVCGDFNATPNEPSVRLMAQRFHSVQSEPTAPTPLRLVDESIPDATGVGSPNTGFMSRCVDYIWIAGKLRVIEAGRCFNNPAPDNPLLWPSDHIGVYVDLEIIE